MSCRKPLSSCVYLIRLFATHKVYVGSSARWPRRGSYHINRLEAGAHENKHLQRAFNKYGDQGMSIEVIEDVDTALGEDHLLRREEHWMQVYRSADRAFGFNIAAKPSRGTLGVKRTPAQIRAQVKHVLRYQRSPKAALDRQRSIASGFGGAKTYVLYSPTGERVEVTNLKAFCAQHDLEYGPMNAMAIGRSIQCHGWKTSPDRKHKVKRAFRLQAPDGCIHEGVGLSDFCQLHGLRAGSAYHLLSGRLKTYQGWRVPGHPEAYYRSRSIKEWVLLSPTGEEVHVTNLNAWCKERGTYPQLIATGYEWNGWRLKPST